MQDVIIVGIQYARQSDEHFKMQMEELAALVETAGGHVLTEITQKRDKTDSRTLVGKGKIEELKNLIVSMEADLVVFYDQLSPSQNRNIQGEIETMVIDRVQLILDIFSLRAKSKEGKLQVALAQNEYLLPRLAGQGKYLSRLGGGIGTRGPGETQLEEDRRVLRNEIQKIKNELKEVEVHRERTRAKRQNSSLFQIGLVGYTNAGKSTILNGLTQADTYEEDQLFATLTPLTRTFELENQFQMSLTDTVGFIQDLPPVVIDAFHSTLEESRNVDLLLIVVDASSPNSAEQQDVVTKLLAELEMHHIPHLFVYNKMDRMQSDTAMMFKKPHVKISARSKADLSKLNDAIIQELQNIYEYIDEDVNPMDIGKWQANRHQVYIEDMSFNEETNAYHIKGYKPQSFYL